MDVMREAVLIYVSALVAISVIVCGIMAAIALLRSREGTARSSGLIFQSGNFLRAVVAVMVVIGVFALALIDRLTSGALAVLAVIAVAEFALGGLERSLVNREIAKAR